MTADGEPLTWPFDSRHIVGPINWSPDGRFIMFTEKNRTNIPFLTTAYSVFVGRVNDGSAVVVKGLGAKAPDFESFHGILNSRSYCERCAAGRLFE